MKIRNYENKNIIKILIINVLIFELITIIFLYKEKMYIYENIQGIVIKDNLVNLIITDKQNKILNKNSNLYLNGKKIKYKIIEDRGYVLKKDRIKYKNVLIRIKFNKKYKVNDSLNLIFKSKKIKTIEIFKIVWEGD